MADICDSTLIGDEFEVGEYLGKLPAEVRRSLIASISCETEAYGQCKSAIDAMRAFEFERALGIFKDAFVIANPRSLNLSVVATLGMMGSYVEMNNHRAAHRIWVSLPTETPFGLSIASLDNHCASTHNLILYRLLRAELHSISTDENAAKASVADIMDALVPLAAEHEPDLLNDIGKRWYGALRNISDDYAVRSQGYILGQIPSLTAENLKGGCRLPRVQCPDLHDDEIVECFIPGSSLIRLSRNSLRKWATLQI